MYYIEYIMYNSSIQNKLEVCNYSIIIICKHRFYIMKEYKIKIYMHYKLKLIHKNK